MLTPLESLILRHGVLMTFAGQPVLPKFDPNSDVDRVPVTPPSWTAYALPQTGEVAGLADTYKLLVTISAERRVVDGKQLGVPTGFVFDQATVTYLGIAYRVGAYDPRSFAGAPHGWDLRLGR